MVTIDLGYGRSSIAFEYDAARYQVLAPPPHDEQTLSDAQIGAAFDNPIDSPALEEIISPGQSVLIVTSDATRATGSAQVVNLLVRRLIQYGVRPRDVSVIFATGIHRPVTAEEKRELLTPFIVERIRTIDHHASDASQFVQLGMTERGTPIEVNRALKEFAKVIITGAVGYHYFAGFTGGRKAICPGLASAQTIAATHVLALDFERGGRRAGVAAGRLEGNAVHEECERVAEMIGPAFALNTIVNGAGRPARIFAGHWRASHRRACEAYAAAHSLLIDGRREVIIVSCGGAPYDINMIQAHKALDMAAQACVDSGTIILVAECSEGFGRADFLKWFELADSRALEARLREAYEVNGQTAWALLTKCERLRVFLISELADEDARRMRMIPAPSLREALAQVSPDARGYIMPRGPALLPFAPG